MVFYASVRVYRARLDKVCRVRLSTGIVATVIYAMLNFYRTWLDKVVGLGFLGVLSPR